MDRTCKVCGYIAWSLPKLRQHITGHAAHEVPERLRIEHNTEEDDVALSAYLKAVITAYKEIRQQPLT